MDNLQETFDALQVAPHPLLPPRVGSDPRFRAPELVQELAGIWRPAVQTRGLENEDGFPIWRLEASRTAVRFEGGQGTARLEGHGMP